MGPRFGPGLDNKKNLQRKGKRKGKGRKLPRERVELRESSTESMTLELVAYC